MTTTPNGPGGNQDEAEIYRQALLASTEGIVITDNRLPDCPIVFSNPGFTHLTGYETEEIVGRNCRFLQGEDTDREAVADIRAALNDGQMHKTVLRNYRKDGSAFWNNLAIAPLHDNEGQVTHFVGVQIDVTTLHEAELERQRLGEEVARLQASQWDSLRDVLQTVTEGRFHLCRSPQDLPPKLASAASPVSLEVSQVRVLRRAVQNASDTISLPMERADDLIVAVGEAATNAVVHGGGGIGEVCSNGEKLQVWIRDHGHGIAVHNLHRAILERGFSTGHTMGYGFWVIIRTCDNVWLHTTTTGTTLVLEQGSAAPPPLWLTHLKSEASDQFGAWEGLL